MSDDILIRPALPEDTEDILDLLRVSLGEGTIPRDVDYWSWKHIRNPFGQSPALVAERDGRIVGLRVFMRWGWTRGGENIEAVRAVDTATHPTCHGRGIFTRLTLSLVERMEAERTEFVFNTPNRFSRPGYLKMGWVDVGRVSLWLRFERPLRIVRSFLSRRGRSRTDWPREDLDQREEFSLAAHLERPELDVLITNRKDPRISTRVSREYLLWRYLHIPGFQYFGAGEWKSGQEALVVFRLREKDRRRELRFSEILVGPGPGAMRAVKRLMRLVSEAAHPDYSAAMAAPGTRERASLRRAGFLPAPRCGPMLTLRPLSDPKDSDIIHLSAWRLSIGDLELF